MKWSHLSPDSSSLYVLGLLTQPKVTQFNQSFKVPVDVDVRLGTCSGVPQLSPAVQYKQYRLME